MLVDPATGALEAMLWHDNTLDASGSATLVMKAVDTFACVTATDAVVPAGSYKLYFVADYDGTNNTSSPADCNATSGYINDPEYGVVLDVTVDGDQIVSLNSTNVTATSALTFNVASPTQSTNLLCSIHAEGVTPARTSHSIAFVVGFNALVGGAGSVVPGDALPAGTYGFYCIADVTLDGAPTAGEADIVLENIAVSGALYTVDLTSGWTTY